MPTNEYGQPTDSKGNVLTQSQVIEAELEKVINGYKNPDGSMLFWNYEQKIKELAALVLKHRHDVYFQAYRDGVVAGRKEGKAEGIAALEGLMFYDRWNKPDELPAEIEKRIALLKGDDDTFASRS